VVAEVGDSGTGGIDLAPSRVPALGPALGVVLCLVYTTTDAGVAPQVTRMCATVIHSVEEEGLVVVPLLEGPATIDIALHAPVRVLVPRVVVLGRGHFLPDDARLATPEVDMEAGEGQGVTRCAQAAHVRGHTLDRSRGLGPCHIRVIQDIHEARLIVGPSAEEGEPRAGAEAEMIFETVGQGRLSSQYATLHQLFCKIRLFLVPNVLPKCLLNTIVQLLTPLR